MNLIEAFILGTLQGITEFLPISSSGHLVICQKLLGIQSQNLFFEVTVHLGTLFSIIAVYYRDLVQIVIRFCEALFGLKLKTAYHSDPYVKLAFWVILGTLPAVVVGMLFRGFVESTFHSITITAIALMVTGCLLLATRVRRFHHRSLNAPNSGLIGIAQAIAILPGISRSGATISTGLLLGIPQTEVARFSFLLAIPAILGAVVLELGNLSELTSEISWQALIIGFLSASTIGYTAIRVLLKILKSGRIHTFGYYCLALGILILIFL
jgi:undecaprenyl-diphosphatase